MLSCASNFHILYSISSCVGGYAVWMEFSIPSGQIVVVEVSFVIPAGRRQSLSLKFCLVYNVPGWIHLLSLELLHTVLCCANV